MVLSRSRSPPVSRDWELPGTTTREEPVEVDVVEVDDGVLGRWWRWRLALDIKAWMRELAWHSPRWQDCNGAKNTRGSSNKRRTTSYTLLDPTLHVDSTQQCRSCRLRMERAHRENLIARRAEIEMAGLLAVGVF